MSKTVKFEDLTKEQQQAVKEAGKKFFFSGLLTGANYGGLIFMSNLIVTMVDQIYFQSPLLALFICILIDVKLFRMMNAQSRENAAEFGTKIKEILKDLE